MPDGDQQLGGSAGRKGMVSLFMLQPDEGHRWTRLPLIMVTVSMNKLQLLPILS